MFHSIEDWAQKLSFNCKDLNEGRLLFLFVNTIVVNTVIRQNTVEGLCSKLTTENVCLKHFVNDCTLLQTAAVVKLLRVSPFVCLMFSKV